MPQEGWQGTMTDHPQGFFLGTEMPTAGWWEALWPDPAGVLSAVGLRSGMTLSTFAPAIIGSPFK